MRSTAPPGWPPVAGSGVVAASHGARQTIAEAGAQLSLASQTYVGLDLEAQTHLLVLDDGSAGRRERRVGFALRAALVAGWRL